MTTTHSAADIRYPSGRLRARGSRLLVSVVGGGVLLTGCSWLTPASTPDRALSCPAAVQQLVDRDVPAGGEIDLVIDGSGSFLGAGAAAREFVARQVSTVVDQAVDQRAALRVIVFTGSAGGAQSVVACPVLAARFRNDAARPARTEALRQTAQTAVWQAVLASRPAQGGPGTSVVGGYLALADAPALTPSPRRAIMLSDGIALPELNLSVDLSSFAAVSMYGVGHTGSPRRTPKVDQLKRTWHRWLLDQHARTVVVSSQSYS